MPSAPAIRLELRESRQQRVLGIALVLIAGLALAWAQWPLGIRVSAVAGFLVATAAIYRFQRTRARIEQVEWRADGRWSVKSVADPHHRAVILRDSRVFGPVLALRFQGADAGSCRLLLWPDSADADSLRHLRIRLTRLQAEQGNSPPDGRVH